MISYEHAPYAVRPDLGQAHARFWERLARPGTGWSASERVAIAREACAERKASLSPYTVAGEHAASAELPRAAVEAVHRITTDAPRLTRAWYQGLLDDPSVAACFDTTSRSRERPPALSLAATG